MRLVVEFQCRGYQEVAYSLGADGQPTPQHDGKRQRVLYTILEIPSSAFGRTIFARSVTFELVDELECLIWRLAALQPDAEYWLATDSSTLSRLPHEISARAVRQNIRGDASAALDPNIGVLLIRLEQGEPVYLSRTGLGHDALSHFYALPLESPSLTTVRRIAQNPKQFPGSIYDLATPDYPLYDSSFEMMAFGPGWDHLAISISEEINPSTVRSILRECYNLPYFFASVTESELEEWLEDTRLPLRKIIGE